MGTLPPPDPRPWQELFVSFSWVALPLQDLEKRAGKELAGRFFFSVPLRLSLGGISGMAASSFFFRGIPLLLTSTRCVSASLIRAAWKTPGSTSGLCGFSSPRCSPRLPTGITASLSVWLKSIMRLSGNSRNQPLQRLGRGNLACGEGRPQPLPAWLGATVTLFAGGLLSCTC